MRQLAKVANALAGVRSVLSTNSKTETLPKFRVNCQPGEGLKGRFRARIVAATDLPRRFWLNSTENCECFSRLELGVGN
jgi:hypothetical protein